MSIKSMTAFARAEQENNGWRLAWEIRSVNHRYLDLAFRLPESFRFIESEARNRIVAQIKRGRLDIGLNLKKAAGGGLELDGELLQALLSVVHEVESQSERPLQTFSALDLMRWPGVLREAELDREGLAPAMLELLEQALASLTAARRGEGAQLAELIQSRCAAIQDLVAKARARHPEVLANIRQKILARLAEIQLKPDQDRLEQEMVYLAQKLDVAEELDRLETHLGETLRALQQKEPAGRRLDFLLQEMNREANTLGSKSADAETTLVSVEMKVLIEQIREQIQNIE